MALLAPGCGGRASSDEDHAGQVTGGTPGGGAAGTTAAAGGTAVGAQSGGGGAAGSPGSDCACANGVYCPTLEYLMEEACRSLQTGEWFAQFWSEDCDLTAVEIGHAEQLVRYYYDPDGMLVGRLIGDAFNGFSIVCGVHCTTPISRNCTWCGLDSPYPTCEP